MDAIIGFITGFADLVSGAFEFLLGVLSDLVFIVSLIVKAVVSLPKLFSWLPSSISALLIAAFAVVALYKFLGREG